jgi:hypothetical protein
MTQIIKAGDAAKASLKNEIFVAETATKRLICVFTVKQCQHLTVYTQKWVVESHLAGVQKFNDPSLAEAYYKRLPA